MAGMGAQRVVGRQRKKRQERGKDIGLLSPPFAIGYRSIILRMTSITFGWTGIMGHIMVETLKHLLLLGLSLQMATAGFVHCPSENEPDVACCFFCLLELEGWEPDDDPWTEHSKRSPNCGYLTLKKDVIELTVADYYQMEKERLKVYLRKVCHRMMGDFRDGVDHMIESLKSQLDTIYHGPPTLDVFCAPFERDPHLSLHSAHCGVPKPSNFHNAVGVREGEGAGCSSKFRASPFRGAPPLNLSPYPYGAHRGAIVNEFFDNELCPTSQSLGLQSVQAHISHAAHLRGDQVRGSEGVKGHVQGQLIAGRLKKWMALRPCWEAPSCGSGVMVRREVVSMVARVG
ncbi:Baculoviral IAP repeat-containing protein 5.1-A [Liparis tanakae]|uniref:Baculoviral IAP repeat-containing protein 5.1-A n=1 Tax=Liparis tanakae TaxID=230148 RepID=A0A4Z2GW00_9TELE|nr:Baculoviral IAP repeat-containing protein 5.1-A [Liparis tanakae]